MRLRESNLHDTGSKIGTQQPPSRDGRHLTARTADGTYNDLENPAMGSAGTRFGRNVPVELTYPENDWALLRPSPRTVSRELLTRNEFLPAMQIGMRANWWGVAGERLHELLGRVSSSEVISGIPGSPKDHYGVPYAITEEFVAVYRMHPLVPDDFDLRSVSGDEPLQERNFREVAGPHVPGLLEQVSMQDLLYSFGVAHPGAITLHNYPRFLQEYERPDGVLMASRRLNSDRFFTTDYNARIYTQTGLDWIDANDMSSVLLRHFPDLLPALRNVENAFAPWQSTGT